MTIHPTAIIDDNASVDPSCKIGAYCVIGAGASIGSGTVLHSHVVVHGQTTIGKDCTIYPFASIGHAPQDLKFKGEQSTVVIGNNTTIREYVTINPGTEGGTMETRVGDNCLLMIGVHLAHDCIVGNNVIAANNATLAGHVVVEDHVVIGGLAAMHQFVRIGQHAMIGGLAGIEHDIPPYTVATGNRATLQGLNLIGLKRRGFSRDDIKNIKDLYQHIFDGNDAIKEKAEQHQPQSAAEQHFIDFILEPSKRGLCRRG